MPRKSPNQRFDEAMTTLTGVEIGQESTMYGPLRDLFIDVLGYQARNVHIDRSGARGRPDLTIMAPGPVEKAVSWIVLEAKDEHNACRTKAKRAALFRTKSKYITADTAWFVMVDPTTLVARPADQGENSSADIEIALDGVTRDQFLERLAPLHSDQAGVPRLLSRFRTGDEDLIAVDKLTGDDADKLSKYIARNAFFDGLEETTQLLQQAAIGALRSIRPDRKKLTDHVEAFESEFGKSSFHPYPVSIEGKPQGREQTLAHGRAAHELNGLLAGSPALARLTLSALPAFSNRTGIDPVDEADKLESFFATETANLILARILLIRFLEDHGFFDETTPDGVVRRRYLCNGGVAAFQGMRDYFNARYTRLLEDAYRTGAKVYAAAFRETEHDWVLDLSDDNLSRTVEWAMYRFARFDFTTIRGDILTGIYDRFLDPKQRKAQGEFYTPPSIARYMLDRLGLDASDSILDPSCGSGTFLIERYQQVVGESADKNLATYEDAFTAMERLAGNDLNPFSAVLTQIQLLWHLLSFGNEVRQLGFPAIHVSERANSLVPTDLRDQTTTRFGDIDVPGYAAVVGNPPYVRPERSQDLERLAHDYYSGTRESKDGTHSGISVESNLYNLFIYRALDYWCSAANENQDTAPGKLAFVIPLNFCAANNSADLRALFAPGGRWTITEIVNLELVWRSVFDADVLPMILFAEARPPNDDELTVIRHVDMSHVHQADEDRKARPTFDLASAPESRVPYPDLFTPEGRIATRLTPERAKLARKLRALAPLSDATKKLWVKHKGGYAVVDEKPTGIGEALWEEQRMIGDGVARRGKGTEGVKGGLDIYKGENIRTGGLVGEPQFSKMDVWNLSSASFWKRPELLPTRMWTLPVLEQIPCAAPFDPAAVAITNTATVFGPRKDLEDFPFDLLLTSRIYGWITLLSLRSSYQNMLRSHMYATTIGSLPWSEDLVGQSADLEALRDAFFSACRTRYEAGDELTRQAAKLDLAPLKTVFKNIAGQDEKLELSDAFGSGEIFPVELVTKDDDPLTLVLSADQHEVTLPSAQLTRFLRLGLLLAEGEDMSRSKLLNLPIPQTDASADELEKLLKKLDPEAAEAAVEDQVDRIDAIVGRALGLTNEEIQYIQQDMQGDAFLSRVRPRYPYFTPALRGRRRSLENRLRYQ